MKETTVEIFGKSYKFMRSPNAGYSDKFGRIVKLAMRFEELSDKFDGMIRRGNGSSQNARLALACKMMMYTGIRIGNEGSAEGYITKPHPNSKAEPKWVQTFGLTTLKKEHVIIAPRRVCLNFIGKKQVENSFILTGDLAKQLRNLWKLSQEETLFDITAGELTKFIKKSVGTQFMPKDFRTLRANMIASDSTMEFLEMTAPRTKSERNKEVKQICTTVSEALNNTPGVCKASYIDPLVWEYYEAVREIKR